MDPLGNPFASFGGGIAESENLRARWRGAMDAALGSVTGLMDWVLPGRGTRVVRAQPLSDAAQTGWWLGTDGEGVVGQVRQR